MPSGAHADGSVGWALCRLCLGAFTVLIGIQGGCSSEVRRSDDMNAATEWVEAKSTQADGSTFGRKHNSNMRSNVDPIYNRQQQLWKAFSPAGNWQLAQLEQRPEGKEIWRMSFSKALTGIIAPVWFWQLLSVGSAVLVIAVLAVLLLSWVRRILVRTRLDCECCKDEMADEELASVPPMHSFMALLRLKAGKAARKQRMSPPPTGDSDDSSVFGRSSASESPCIRRGPAYRLEPGGGHRFLPSTVLAERLRQQSVASCESLEVARVGRLSTDDASEWGTTTPQWRLEALWEADAWKLDPDDVQICLDSKNRPWQLGCGGFGRVFRAELAGSTPVAVKFVTRQSPRELKRFVHEIGILKSLRHTNIVQFLGAFIDREQMILVTEYMAGGDLYNVIGHDMSRSFSWYQRGQQAALDIVRGVVHMHARKVIHLDIKSANILLARDGTAKIADVGLAKVLSREITNVSMESTFDWAAPEVLAGFTCSEKADIWSLGVVLWEIITGEAPKLRQLRPLRVPEECPAEIRDLIVACRASAPESRPSAREVFSRLSAVVDASAPCPARHILSAAGLGANRQCRPLWAPCEHPAGEQSPSFKGSLVDHEPVLSSSQQRRWGPGGARGHRLPAWICSAQEARAHSFRATSM